MLNNLSKPHYACCLALLLCVSSAPVSAGPVAAPTQEVRIAAVNSDRILRESALAKAAQEKLKQEFSKRDQELQALAKTLKAKSNKLDKNAAALSDPERKRAQLELTQLDADFQRKQREFSEDLNQRRNEELAAVLERANKVIKQISEARNYDLIVQEAVYVNPRIDITDDVLKALSKPNGGF
ncbi:MAG: periplasmic chaperone for outer membrane proteins Skp [Glomeribacter sp. 1016415]|uniref:OmpH family outer membrane protein n=1 Tax=Mycoavidus cysteinexigens TaxID=1553431 RepID=UPI0003448E48|nr:periplasmic chaperone for outer membrane proteins Skp [Glomeribacter sp. 1016415]GAM52254.1 outer membrane protein H precursor [bacterium endosymbiont of Mortierella elongata FMR23-6]